jgi:hypothetical protein
MNFDKTLNKIITPKGIIQWEFLYVVI